uniref:Protease Do-like PDZ domain-containing protein n=1 Tax=Arcella intermedia TaxID=1963864 RepID=A0A6B2L2R0_9EUKA
MDIYDNLPLDGVVKIFANLTDPDYESPWQMCQSIDVTGSGFIIENNRIITNAHVVANSTFISVRKYSEAVKYVGRLVCISHDCDMAILAVDDKKFWEGMKPLTFASRVPHLQEKVFVAGYPEGGDTISVTRGIVSRIELGAYTRNTELLTVQIDAAINPGNSGGPVFAGSEVVGIAFSGLDDADGIGYIIPFPVYQYFLKDFEQTGKWNGFCSLGIRYQYMENKGLRLSHQMPDDLTGILIRYIDPLSPCHGLMLPDDVLCSVNNTHIANDGTIKWRNRERVAHKFVLQQSPPGTKMTLQVFREGELKTIPFTTQFIPPFIPATYDAPPTYVCWAGLVFVPLSIPFMDSYGGEYWARAPLSLQSTCESSRRKWKDQQIIVLARILVDEVNWGYEDTQGSVVTKLNQIEIINLKHLYDIIQESKDTFLKFELGMDGVVCINREAGMKATEKILKVHKINSMTNLLPKKNGEKEKEKKKKKHE